MDLNVCNKSAVIPLAKKLKVPSEPSLGLPTPPDANQLGMCLAQIKHHLQVAKKKILVLGQLELGNKERDCRMAKGFGDKFLEWQKYVPPKFNDKEMMDFQIEMCFSYLDDDVMPSFNWAHGKVVVNLNVKKRVAIVKWDGLVLLLVIELKCVEIFAD